MKIGELFVSLGFDIKGQKEFDAVQSGLNKAAVAAGKLTLGVGALNLALLTLLESGMKVAVGLKNFALQTALSTEELQRWQHIAAVNDVTADELTGTIKALQDTRTQFAMGEPQAVGAWSMLGIDPTQDPFKILEQLRTKLTSFADRGIARNLAGRIGIGDNVFQMLVASNAEFEKWNRNFEVTREQTERLRRLDSAWKDLKFEVTAIKTQFASALAPVFERVTVMLTKAGKAVAGFTNWLHSNTTGAVVARRTLAALGVALVAIGIGIAAVTTAVAAAAAIIALLSPALIAVTAAALPFAAIFTAVAAAIAFAALMLDDWWTAVHGGKSAFDWSREIAVVDAMAKALERVVSLWQKLKGWGIMGPFGMTDVATQPARARGAGTSMSQSNDIDIHIDGAASPESTGRQVTKTLNDELTFSSYQSAAPYI